MTTHKAKTLDGEWVEGWYWYSKNTNSNFITNESINDILIDPSTLCERVRGTEFFEGDEVESAVGLGIGYITYDEGVFGWVVQQDSRTYLPDPKYWKPTGRNKHD